MKTTDFARTERTRGGAGVFALLAALLLAAFMAFAAIAPQAAYAGDPIDINTCNISNVNSSYGCTGSVLNVTPVVKTADKSKTLVEGADYTYDITEKGKTASVKGNVKDKGEYTITITGKGDYENSWTTDFKVIDYLTITVNTVDEDGKTIVGTQTKTITYADFVSYASESTDPVSGMYGGGSGSWSVCTAASYVTFDTLIEKAGIASAWKSGSTLSYGEGKKVTTVSYDDLMKQCWFYPNTIGSTRDTSDAVRVQPEGDTPLVLSLTEYAQSLTGIQTAGQVEDLNVTSANSNNTPRVVSGITEEQYTDTENSVGGMRLWSQVTALTITVPQTDISSAKVKGVEETYGYTGNEFTIVPTVSVGDAKLKSGTDYTYEISDGKSGSTVKEIGDYTCTITGTGLYTGTKVVNFKVVDYFTLYVKDMTGKTVVKEAYTKADFEKLKSTSTDAASGMFFKGDVWNVCTAATYVTFDDLLADAKATAYWGPGYSIVYGGDTSQGKGSNEFTYAQLMSQNAFYPKTAGATGDATDAEYFLSKDATPFVLSITEYSGATSAASDAAAVEAANVKAANGTNEPRAVMGINEDMLDDQSAAGKPYWSNVTSITIVATNDLAQAQVQVEDVAYTGDPVEPAVTVTTCGNTLKEGTDYTVEYANNENVGTATATVTGMGSYKGTQTVKFAVTLPEEKQAATQVAGDDRYDTMAQIVSKAYPTGSYGVVVATGVNFPDALAASSLAGVKDWPVVLTDGTALTAQASATIDELYENLEGEVGDGFGVYVIGGENAISDDVYQALKNKTYVKTIERLSGTDRFSTADKIYAAGLAEGAWSDTAIIATGTKFADALAISGYANSAKAPIFLADADGNLTDAAQLALKTGGFQNVIILGGEKAIPATMDAWVQENVGVEASRLKGDDRYGTSKAIAQFVIEKGGTANGACIATGQNFPDALAGGALAATFNTVLLLADDGFTSSFDVLKDAGVEQIYFLGGDNAVTPTVQAAAKKAAGLE